MAREGALPPSAAAKLCSPDAQHRERLQFGDGDSSMYVQVESEVNVMARGLVQCIVRALEIRTQPSLWVVAKLLFRAGPG